MSDGKDRGYIVRHISEVAPVPCPCGSSTRIITRADTPVANLHVTHIKDSTKHYHKGCTEYYYILEGEGFMELNDDVVALKAGLTIVIEPGTAHRGYGDFKTLIVGVPAWEHTDEFFCKGQSLATSGSTTLAVAEAGSSRSPAEAG